MKRTNRRRPFAMLATIACFVASIGTNVGAKQGERSDILIATAGDSIVAVIGGRAIRRFGPAGVGAPLEGAVGSQGYGRILKRLACDRGRTSRCMVGFAAPAADRSEWHSLDLDTGDAVPGWANIAATNATVEAVGFEDGTVVWSAGTLGDRRPEDLSPGLYMTQAGAAPKANDRILEVPAENGFPCAEIVEIDGRRLVFARSSGLGGRWMLIDPQGRVVSERVGGAGYVATRGQDVLLVTPEDVTSDTGRVLPAGSLATLSLKEALGGRWRLRPIYAAGIDGPPLRGRGPQREALDAGASIAFIGSRALGIADHKGGTALVEICRRDGGLVAVPIRTFDVGSSLTGLAGTRGSHGILTDVRRDGYAAQSVVTFADDRRSGDNGGFAECGGGAPSITPVATNPASTPPPAGQAIVRNQAKSPDGSVVDYAVLGPMSADSRVLIRAYGAFGAPVTEHLTTGFERTWVASGNVVVVPVLRGDGGRDRAWIAQGRGDLKSRTTDDLVAVAEDLRRRGRGGSRFDVVGTSAGAFPAAKAGLRRPDLFGTVMLISGALDLQVLSDDRSADVAELGSPEGGFARWFGGVRAPAGGSPVFVLVHDGGDERTGVKNSFNFQAYAKSLGYRADFFETRGQAHGDLSDPVLVGEVMKLVNRAR